MIQLPSMWKCSGLLLGAMIVAGAPLVAQDRPNEPGTPASRPAQNEGAERRSPERPEERRADALRRWFDNIELVQGVVYATTTSADGSAKALELDAAFPRQGGDAPLPCIVYIHGGGWSGGHRSAGVPFTIAFANGGYVAVTISYRLSGEATYPAAVHDCKAAVRFLRANAEELGIDPDRIGVWGHSAGGHLSSMIGLTGGDAALDGEVGTTGVSSAVACFVPVSGPSALAAWLDNSMVTSFLGAGSRDEITARAKDASPITHVDKSDPPALIVHGDKDDLVNVRQAHLLHNQMKEAGATSTLHIVEGGDHGLRDKRAYEAIAAFFDEQLGGNASRVLATLDWNQLNQLRPGRGPQSGTPTVRPQQRPERPGPPAQPEAPRDESTTSASFDEAALEQMTLTELQELQAEVATELRRAPNLDAETKERLIREFRILQNEIRSRRGSEQPERPHQPGR